LLAIAAAWDDRSNSLLSLQGFWLALSRNWVATTVVSKSQRRTEELFGCSAFVTSVFYGDFDKIF
jgi:hypothetical protein